LRRVSIRSRHEKRIRTSCRIQGLAESSEWQRCGFVEVLRRRNKKIDVSLEPEMLKPIVEQMNGAPESRFRHAAGKISIRANKNGGTRYPSQHQRLVP
jgi:hypothetical protein